MTNVITFKMNVNLFTPNWVYVPKCVLFSKLGPLTIQMLVILYRIQKIDGMQRFTKLNIEGFDEVQNSFEIPRPDCCLKIIIRHQEH